MDLYVLDNEYQTQYNIDVFESIIWKLKYNGCGEFEFYTPLNDYILEIFTFVREIKNGGDDCYVWLKDYDSYMIIEDMQITTDIEKGYHFIVKGHGLESILNRRIIWGKTNLDSKFQYAINRLLNENVISPDNSSRTISNFIFEEVDDEYIQGLTVQAQYTGSNIYDTIEELCGDAGLGFDVTFDQNYNFVFTLTNGVDRSYEQDDRPYVVFSRDYENLMSSEYNEETQNYKNVALVAGEDENLSQKRKNITLGDETGLRRRELFVDARDLQSEYDDGTTMSDDVYTGLLEYRGYKKLLKKAYVQDMTCEIEAKNTFEYGYDFFLGDLVQVVNDLGISTKTRVTEFTIVQDDNGFSTYPTFAVDIEDDLDDEEDY